MPAIRRVVAAALAAGGVAKPVVVIQVGVGGGRMGVWVGGGVLIKTWPLEKRPAALFCGPRPVSFDTAVDH